MTCGIPQVLRWRRHPAGDLFTKKCTSWAGRNKVVVWYFLKLL